MNRRRHEREGERGVAMFIVLMLVVMVSAAGVFVAKSSSLEIRSAGYVRQAGQTHYVAESGLTLGITQLRTNCRAYFTERLRRDALAGVTIPGCERVSTASGFLTLPCFSFSLNEFNSVYSVPVFDIPSGSGTARLAGSFGRGFVTPAMQVRVTELSADTSPQRGSDMTNPGIMALPMRYEISSVGMTAMDRTVFGSDTTNAARGEEAARAITVVQCN